VSRLLLVVPLLVGVVVMHALATSEMCALPGAHDMRQPQVAPALTPMPTGMATPGTTDAPAAAVAPPSGVPLIGCLAVLTLWLLLLHGRPGTRVDRSGLPPPLSSLPRPAWPAAPPCPVWIRLGVFRT
jgi:hypothetical protein